MAVLANTEEWVFGRLGKLFPSPAFVLLPQVRNCTGYSRRVRTIDALAISTWPSRGLWFAGIEIKVSRADWRRELANPVKAEAIQKYCGYWYLAAPKGVVPLAEVPEIWGLIECDARAASIVRKAPPLKPCPPDHAFVCSVLRAASEASVPACQVAARVEEARAKVIESAERSIDFRTKQLRDSVAAFESASGIRITDEWTMRPIGNAVKLLMETGVDRMVEQVAELRRTAQGIVHAIDAAQGRIPNADLQEVRAVNGQA